MADDVTLITVIALLGIAGEIGGLLVFRTITGVGPRAHKLVSFGLAGTFLTVALFMAHAQAPRLYVLASFGIAALAQAWSLWIMCERHWIEWRRRKPYRKD